MDIRKTLLPVMLIPLTAMASEPSDTTLMVNNRQITVNDSAGITSVTVYDKSGGQLTRTYETCFADGQEVERVYVTSPFIPQMLGKNKRPMESHYPFFFMGYNLLADNAFGFSGSSALHTRDSKSWTTAMQTTWAYNHFQGNNVMTTTDGMSSLEKKEDVKVKKSYITYSTIRIPLMMEWSEKSFYAGLGASVDMRMSGKSKYRANKKTRTQTDDINLNPLGLNLEMRLGYGALMIYGRAGLTPLLKTGRAPKCYSASFGMGIRL